MPLKLITFGDHLKNYHIKKTVSLSNIEEYKTWRNNLDFFKGGLAPELKDSIVIEHLSEENTSHLLLTNPHLTNKNWCGNILTSKPYWWDKQLGEKVTSTYGLGLKQTQFLTKPVFLADEGNLNFYPDLSKYPIYKEIFLKYPDIFSDISTFMMFNKKEDCFIQIKDGVVKYTYHKPMTFAEFFIKETKEGRALDLVKKGLIWNKDFLEKGGSIAWFNYLFKELEVRGLILCDKGTALTGIEIDLENNEVEFFYKYIEI